MKQRNQDQAVARRSRPPCAPQTTISNSTRYRRPAPGGNVWFVACLAKTGKRLFQVKLDNALLEKWWRTSEKLDQSISDTIRNSLDLSLHIGLRAPKGQRSAAA